MIKHLISRPIAVTMSIIAVIVIGLVSLNYIPVSLMPDIDIPQITVQVPYPGSTVREVESKVINRLKNQLMQVTGVKSINTESKNDAGTIYLGFEPGSNIDLLFIEVNEKLDRAMSDLPEEVERPKVIKASATDIPAFYLNISLKDEAKHSPDKFPEAGVDFAQLGDFARTVVRKRIEQLPQTAMVDISGVLYPELLCVPDYEKLEATGITIETLKSAIEQNDITLGVLNIVDGIYRYNIQFNSQLTGKEDIENIYLNIDGRIYQFKDFCKVVEKPATRKGLIRSGRNNGVTLAIIKQSDAQMAALQESITETIADLEKNYGYLKFELTRDQTKLLTYSMNNLGQNLIFGAILACLVLFVFMKDLRSPILVIITIPLSLIVTLIMFHAIGISLNIISLSGLILGVGMMVDNSIIVIDNISQRWSSGLPLKEAICVAVAEVFSPMLSSVLTTCSVFLPLIFLSGTTGALFYDQAMAVSIALFSSLFVSVLAIPVYFALFYKKYELFSQTKLGTKKESQAIYIPYEIALRWVLRNRWGVIILAISTIPLSWMVYNHVEKSRLPLIEHDDALVNIDWNAGISVAENDRRVCWLLEEIEDNITTSTSMVGVQEFMLSHTKELTSSESILYIQSKDAQTLEKTQNKIVKLLKKNYPNSKVEFEISGNVFDMIFAEGEADLEVHLQDIRGYAPTVELTREFVDTLSKNFPEIAIPAIITEENLRYEANLEQMLIYDVTYQMLFAKLRELINQESFHEINQGGYSLPITLGDPDLIDGGKLSEMKVKNRFGIEIPISYLIKESRGEEFKKLYGGSGGNYYPIKIFANENQIEEVMKFIKNFNSRDGRFSASFEGEYFSSQEMILELVIILVVAILLLYFILAAQFESLIQPLIILTEIIIDIFFVLLGFYLLGESINLMSLIGIVVMSGIIINDSILKVDTINNLARGGMPLLKAIFVGGHSRLKPIIMTSLTTILAIAPFLQRVDMGSALQFPLSLAIIIGMIAGTVVSLFFIPAVYYTIYKNRKR